MSQSRPGLQKKEQRHPADDTPEERPTAADSGAADPQVTFSVRGPKSMRTRLRLYAAKTDEAIQDITMDALKEYLDRHGG